MNEIYQKLTSFHWEPSFQTMNRYLVRRRQGLVHVSRKEVSGSWHSDGQYETYRGEDYGREVKGYLA